MKKVILLLVFSFLALSGFSQDKDTPLYYKLKVVQKFYECGFEGDTIKVDKKPVIQGAPGGAKFTIVNTIGENYVIRFWTWSHDTSQTILKANAMPTSPASDASAKDKKQYNKNLNRYLNNDKYSRLNVNSDLGPVDNYRFFLISKTTLNLFAEELVSHFSPTFGTAVLPFKLRSHNGADFTKDITITGIGGVRWLISPKNDISLSLLTGVGISSVVVDSSNSKVSGSEDRAAITFSYGLVLGWRGLQFGVYSGFDWLSKKNADAWAYHDKVWYGFGVGASIYSDDYTKKKEGDN